MLAPDPIAAATPSASPETSPVAQTPPSRLPFVDGLRGLAAFIVMAGHAVRMVPHMPAAHALYCWRLATPWEQVLWPLLFGDQMVALFIFVSGFSLGYSELRRRDRQGPTPLGEFVRRRAWRILPVYYASLLLGAAMIVAIPAMRQHTGSVIDALTPVSWEAFVAHFLLIHHLFPDWAYRFNTPLWSIPVEIQLYMLFPLLMAAMTRLRPLVGAAVALAAFHLAGCAVDLSFVKFFDYFVVGAATAGVALRWPLRRVAPFLPIGVVALAVGLYRGPDNFDELMWLPAFVGLTLTAFHWPTGWPNVLAWRPVRALGDCSYSLYAVHFPLLFWLYMGLHALGWSARAEVLAMLVIGSALSLAAAWAMHVTVERYSLSRIREGGARFRGGRAPASPVSARGTN